MIATREEVMELAREYPGTEEDRKTIVDLVMLMLQYPTDVVENAISQIKDEAAQAVEGDAKKTIDVELVLVELAQDMTVEELGEWKQSIQIIAEEQAFDPDGPMATMFKGIIDTTIEDKQTRQVNGGRKFDLPPAR